METSRLRENAGLVGWAVVGGAIIATEILSPQTLSTASDRILEGTYGKLSRVAWVVGSTVLFAHTMNLIPEKYDPIHQIAGRAVGRLGLDRWSL